jgi:hypothetical protein
MNNGTECEIGPGDVFTRSPDPDSEITGTERTVSPTSAKWLTAPDGWTKETKNTAQRRQPKHVATAERTNNESWSVHSGRESATRQRDRGTATRDRSSCLPNCAVGEVGDDTLGGVVVQ